jgi:SNF2 family DNA or RNA helicase
VQVIEAYELFKQRDGSTGGRGGSWRGRTPKFDVLLTSFEILRDSRVFESFQWAALVVDEAHRLKNTKSAVRSSIRALSTRFTLLLTGTPIQNNMAELFSIMNLVNERKFPDLADFLARFGDPVPTPDQLRDLQVRPCCARASRYICDVHLPRVTSARGDPRPGR